MSLLTDWRKAAYETERDQRTSDLFWANYFNIEKGIYSQILSQNGTPVSGTVKALAEKFETNIAIIWSLTIVELQTFVELIKIVLEF